MKLILGPHTSIAKGYYKAAVKVSTIGANTFQFFTRNPRGGSIRAFDQQDVDKFAQFLEENHFGPLLAHAPYTYNMASAKEDVREFTRERFREDLELLEKLPCHLYNFHPGSFTKGTLEEGINYVVEILNDTISKDITSTILLETMSGKGTEIGKSFEEIAEIISRVKLNEKLGVCLDTCHVYSAGYDIKNDLSSVLQEFDQIIGLDRLKAIHLNDSKTEYSSNKDRHEKLGEGSIGEALFIEIINHPELRQLPIFLETPNEDEGYAKEIKFLKEHQRSFNQV